MDRSGLLPGEIKPVQQIEHAVLTIGHAEALLGKPTEVLGRPAAEAVTLGIRPAQHQRFEGRHLAFTQERRSAAAWTIAQAPDALGVEADHPVPERLPVEAGLLGRPAHGSCRRARWPKPRAGRPPGHPLPAEPGAATPQPGCHPGSATLHPSRLPFITST